MCIPQLNLVANTCSFKPFKLNLNQLMSRLLEYSNYVSLVPLFILIPVDTCPIKASIK